MRKLKVWLPTLIILVVVLGYAGAQYRQQTRDWEAFDAAWQNVMQGLEGKGSYDWKPGVFAATGAMNLAGCNVTDEKLAHLRGVASLVILNLSGTKITDAGLDHLKSLTNLRELDLTGTQVSDQAVDQLRQALPQCTIRH